MKAWMHVCIPESPVDLMYSNKVWEASNSPS